MLQLYADSWASLAAHATVVLLLGEDNGIAWMILFLKL